MTKITITLKSGRVIENFGEMETDPTGLSDVLWFNWPETRLRLRESEIETIEFSEAKEPEVLAI